MSTLLPSNHSMPSENTEMMEQGERVVDCEGMEVSLEVEAASNEPTQKPVADVDDENEEETDEEEALFVEIEKEKEKEEAEEAAHPHPHHYDIESAPKLLQDALKTGVIKTDLDPSDAHVLLSPGKEVKKEPAASAISGDMDEEKKNEFGDADVDADSDVNHEHAPTIAEKVSVSISTLARWCVKRIVASDGDFLRNLCISTYDSLHICAQS